MSSYSSIDPAYLAQQYTQIERAPKEAQLNAKAQSYNSRLRAVKSLKSQLSSFQSKLADFKKSDSLLVNSTKSDQESILTASADSTAITGHYQLFVKQLAQKHQIALPFNSATPLPTDGAIELGVAGKKFTLNLNSLPKDASLSDLASAINNHAENDGLSAAVMRQDNQSFLVLTAKESGWDNKITLKHSAGTPDRAEKAFNKALQGKKVLSEAKNAKFSLGSSDSITLVSSSNTVTDVIDGVTLELKKVQAAGDTPVQIDIASDQAATKEKIQSFVNEVNSMVDLISNNSTLKRDSTARSIKSQIRSSFQGEFSGSRLYSMGIKFDEKGKLKVDSEQLDKALTDNPQLLSQMLTGKDGLIEKLTTKMKPYSGSVGLLQTQQQTIQSGLELIAKKRERLNYSMERTHQRYLTQFTNMQVTIAQLESSMSNF